MDLRTNRRRFLQLAGTSATLSLAGCSAPTPDDAPADSDGASAQLATVTVALEIDEEALQAAQEDLVTQVQNGTINQTEAQEELYATESELLTEAATAFEERVADRDSLTIDQKAPEIGVMLVSGLPVELIDSIGQAEVRGLFSAKTYEQALAQQQTAQ
jgi:hypothetical protein